MEPSDSESSVELTGLVVAWWWLGGVFRELGGRGTTRTYSKGCQEW
jgi:hypothetical protein